MNKIMDYEKLLAKAKEAYKKCATDAEKRRLETIFPELTESEDERIRKKIISLVKYFYGSSLRHIETVSKDDMIVWLEKQEEKSNTESIYETLEKVKVRERKELIEMLRLYGKKVNDGYEWHFENNRPIVAAYDYDDPCDVVILSIRVDKDGNITIIGDEKNDRGNEHEINIDDIFAGHVEFITNEIYMAKYEYK